MGGIRASQALPPRRRSLLWAPLLLLLLAAAALGASCRATLTPPAAPADPVSVFLLDHGRHSSLVLPREGGGSVRYSYGDWRYYALRRQGLGESAAAVLWPSRAGLGRRELKGEASASELRRTVRVGMEELFELRVERSAALDLERELEALFAARLAQRVTNTEYDLEFVPHPERYHLLRNSNHMVARWLRRLGCDVAGPTILSAWRVVEGT